MIDLLATFVIVAENSSFAKASKVLFMSTTGVIKQIDALENDLGLSLFVRSSRGIKLTPAGRSLYIDAQKIIKYTKDAVIRAKEASSERPTVRILVPQDAPRLEVQSQWSAIQNSVADVKIELISYGLGLEHVNETYADLGANIDAICSVYDPNNTQKRGMQALKLCDTPICCMIPILHHLASHEHISRQDLIGERVIVIKDGRYPILDPIAKELVTLGISCEEVDDASVEVYDRCINENKIFIGFKATVAPMLKSIPFEAYKAPFGLYYYHLNSKLSILINDIKKLQGSNRV